MGTSQSPTFKLDAQLKQLLLLSYEGDHQAYEKFLHLCNELLTRYMQVNSLASCFSSAEKEELVQDILFLIHRKKSSYRTDKPVTPWVYAIAKHRVIDQLRKKRIATVDIFTQAEHDLSYMQQTSSANDSSSVALNHQRAEEIAQLLRRLPARQQEIVLLAKVHDFTALEIAKRLGMSLSAVKTSLYRSLKSLRHFASKR